MKPKSILIAAYLFTFSFPTFSQLKVDQYGRLAVGSNYTHPEFACSIKGNLLLTNYPATPTYELRMKVGNGSPGVDFGSSGGSIAIYASYAGYNSLYAANYYKVSDMSIKSDIIDIHNGLNKLLKIRPVSYSVTKNTMDSSGNIQENKIPEFGFISQEIEKAFPEVKITDDRHDYKLLDYDQIIPVAVAAIKEQQKIIDSLSKELSAVKEQIAIINNTSDFNRKISTDHLNVLEQNVPNPFDKKTEIRYNIDVENFRSASILIFNMNGQLIKEYEIRKSGSGTVEVNASELNAGMYIYTLIVNNNEVDSKRMILVN